jgi:hypothetical protein
MTSTSKPYWRPSVRPDDFKPIGHCHKCDEWHMEFGIGPQEAAAFERARLALEARTIEVDLTDLLSQMTLVSLADADELRRMVYG